jgi:uncharacterized protein YbjT (DUF2867 family)
LALVDAAEALGVARFVYTSVSPALPADNPFVSYKRQVEQALQRSRMAWTILQPAAFMEIHAGPFGGWDFSRCRARVIGSGRAVVGYVSVCDVAAFAVASIEHPAAAGRSLHITGPEPLTGMDAVAIAERVTRRRFRVQRVPLAALRVIRAVIGPFNPLLASFMAMGIAMDSGEQVAMDVLWREFGIQPTTFEQYVRSASSAAASDSRTN